MPRPEKPVPGDGPLAELARALRQLKERDGGTYRELATRPAVNYSAAQLAAAASGTSCPTRSVVMAYVPCRANKQERAELGALWDRADAARTTVPPFAGHPLGLHARSQVCDSRR